MTQSAPLLSVRSLRFSAGKAPILTGVDFDLRAGEFVGLIGANGAGKTTLLRVVSGLWPGASGEVLLLGRPLREYSTREVARIVAHVPQSTRVDFAFTSRDVVLMGRSPHLSRFQVESARDRSIAERALRTTGTLHLADRLVTTLSGGELQRVVLARALAQEPRVLLLDEPTSNLDIRHQVHVLRLARDLAHETGLGVLAAIHDIGQAARYCDRLVMMMCGRIVADGPPDAVLTPERLAQVFEIEARLYRDPYTGHIALSLQ